MSGSALASALASGSVSASHQILREPCLNFSWEACFLFPMALAFDFCYDFDLCSQGQVVRAFFIRMGFPKFCQKYKGALVRKLHKLVAHDLIIVDLQLMYMTFA